MEKKEPLRHPALLGVVKAGEQRVSVQDEVHLFDACFLVPHLDGGEVLLKDLVAKQTDQPRRGFGWDFAVIWRSCSLSKAELRSSITLYGKLCCATQVCVDAECHVCLIY